MVYDEDESRSLGKTSWRPKTNRALSANYPWETLHFLFPFSVTLPSSISLGTLHLTVPTAATRRRTLLDVEDATMELTKVKLRLQKGERPAVWEAGIQAGVQAPAFLNSCQGSAVASSAPFRAPL